MNEKQDLSNTYLSFEYDNLIKRGLFTWPNQDDRMNMTQIGEYDQKIDNDKH